jgi:hypothetical protein
MKLVLLLQILFRQELRLSGCSFEFHRVSGKACFFPVHILHFQHFAHIVSGQLWGFIASAMLIITIVLHPLFFTIGLLGHFPYIVTDVLWPRLRTFLMGLLTVEILIFVARKVAQTWLVCMIFPD